jgi:hypothetical protein
LLALSSVLKYVSTSILFFRQILDVSINAGFPFSDVHFVGSTVTVTYQGGEISPYFREMSRKSADVVQLKKGSSKRTRAS